MRIFSSPHGDPVLVATIGQLHAIQERTAEFVDSAEAEIEIKANCIGSPEPYGTLLHGLRPLKFIGSAFLSISDSG